MKTAKEIFAKTNKTAKELAEGIDILYSGQKEINEDVRIFVEMQIIEYAKQKIKPEKEAIKIISDTLNRVFDMGLKQSPHDAENSEFYAPLLDLDIAPNLYKKLINDH